MPFFAEGTPLLQDELFRDCSGQIFAILKDDDVSRLGSGVYEVPVTATPDEDEAFVETTEHDSLHDSAILEGDLNMLRLRHERSA